MNRFRRTIGWFLLGVAPALALEPPSGNQFAHLDSRAIYYPSRTFAKLTTPSWFGEPGVKAVVILTRLDTMRVTVRVAQALGPQSPPTPRTGRPGLRSPARGGRRLRSIVRRLTGPSWRPLGPKEPFTGQQDA